jgi:hypothetical protein
MKRLIVAAVAVVAAALALAAPAGADDSVSQPTREQGGTTCAG